MGDEPRARAAGLTQAQTAAGWLVRRAPCPHLHRRGCQALRVPLAQAWRVDSFVASRCVRALGDAFGEGSRRGQLLSTRAGSLRRGLRPAFPQVRQGGRSWVRTWTRVCQSGAVATPVATRAVAQPTEIFKACDGERKAGAGIPEQCTRSSRWAVHTDSPYNGADITWESIPNHRRTRPRRSRRGLAIRSRATDGAAGHHFPGELHDFAGTRSHQQPVRVRVMRQGVGRV